MTRIGCAALLLLSLLKVPAVFAQSDPNLIRLTESFAHPPDDSRILVRWWWFGPAVTKSEIKRELEEMKAAGVGGVEIATLYPLALDDPQTEIQTNTSRPCASRPRKLKGWACVWTSLSAAAGLLAARIFQ